MGKPTFNKARFPKAEIRELREQGMKVKDIAVRYGCGVSTMAAILREYGLTQGRRKTCTEECEVPEAAETPQSELLEQYEQHIKRTAEIIKQREEKQKFVHWKNQKKLKKRKTKLLKPEEIPRGYIW